MSDTTPDQPTTPHPDGQPGTGPAPVPAPQPDVEPNVDPDAQPDGQPGQGDDDGAVDLPGGATAGQVADVPAGAERLDEG